MPQPNEIIENEYARLKAAERYHVKLISEYRRRILHLEEEIGRKKRIREFRRKIMTPNQERLLLYSMCLCMIIFWIYLVLNWK